MGKPFKPPLCLPPAQVYEQASSSVPKVERISIYDIYLAKASEFFGIGKVREIYEMAIQAEEPHELPDADCCRLCLRYSQLERKLGEIDRARAILVHASHLADPRRQPEFWDEWNQFEVKHGNEDTFRCVAGWVGGWVGGPAALQGACWVAGCMLACIPLCCRGLYCSSGKRRLQRFFSLDDVDWLVST